MAWLSDEAAAALAHATVRFATLVEMRFATETMHVWTGVGRRLLNGVEHDGIGTLGTIEGLTQSRAPTSEKVTLKLSCVNPSIAALAVAGNAEVRGRLAIIRLQLFREDWSPLGVANPVFLGIMQRVGIERLGATEEDGGTRVASLEVENLFSGRSRPTHGLYTDAHQQADFAGDNGCRFVSKQQNQVIKWPSV